MQWLPGAQRQVVRLASCSAATIASTCVSVAGGDALAHASMVHYTWVLSSGRANLCRLLHAQGAASSWQHRQVNESNTLSFSN